MLNEDRIRVMAKLAVMEEKNGKNTELASKYYKKDYVSCQMIWTAVTTTCAYLLIVILGVSYKLEFFLQSVQTLNPIEIGQRLLLVYILFLSFFEIIAFFIYKKKFERAQQSLRRYCATLHELEKLYNQERPGTAYSSGGNEI